MKCPSCGGPGGVPLLIFVAPCDACVRPAERWGGEPPDPVAVWNSKAGTGWLPWTDVGHWQVHFRAAIQGQAGRGAWHWRWDPARHVPKRVRRQGHEWMPVLEVDKYIDVVWYRWGGDGDSHDASSESLYQQLYVTGVGDWEIEW